MQRDIVELRAQVSALIRRLEPEGMSADTTIGVKQAAAILNVSDQRMRQLAARANGVLGRQRPSDRKWEFSLGEVERFALRRRAG